MKYTTTVTKLETKEITVTAPVHFGMFSSEGNRRLRNYADTLMRNVEAGKPADNEVLKYLKKYHRLCAHPKFGEADDTMVREIVRGFAEEILRASGYTNALEKEIELNEKATEQLWKRS